MKAVFDVKCKKGFNCEYPLHKEVVIAVLHERTFGCTYCVDIGQFTRYMYMYPCALTGWGGQELATPPPP